MKRTFVLLATLLLSFGLINAANKVTPIMNPDTAWTNAGQETLCEFWIENDIQWHGFTSGFQTTSTTGGVTWTWITEPDGYGPFGPGTGISTTRIIAGTRIDPLSDTFDGVLLVKESDTDGASPDSIMFGANRQFDPGMAPGSAEAMLSWRFHASGPTADVVGDICFTGIDFPQGGDFIYVNSGLSYQLDDQDVTFCYPVKEMGTMLPEFDVCPGTVTNFSHCGTGNATVHAFDPGNPTPLPITYSVDSEDGAGSATVGSTDGLVVYTGSYPADINTVITVTIAATNSGGSTFCDVQFTPTNIDPWIDAGDSPVFVGKGNLLTKDDITGGDDDACDVATFDFVSIEMVGDPAHVYANTPEIDPITGVFTWLTTTLDVGDHNVTVSIDDGMHLKAAPVLAGFMVTVLAVEPYEVQIEKAEGSGDGVLQGHFVDLAVTLNSGSELLGGYDFLIGYDGSALTFTEATPGDLMVNCGWEFFTYRYNWNGNCGNQCPSGLLRIVAIADVNDGPNHPTCYMDGPPSTLANLTFLVTNDRTFECMYAPVYFYWMDCGDNTMSSMTGDSLFVNRFVYNYWDGVIWTPIHDYAYGFPGIYGAPDDPCMVGDKDDPIRFIDFKNGGVDIICSGDIDARGDINCNGVANEIADAVMFTRYFIMGLPAFDDHSEASIAASDVNADGMALSVADLVYLVRVIVGDALPYPKPLPGSMMNLEATQVNGEIVVNYEASYESGAALLVFNVTGNVGNPTLGDGAANMDLTYDVKNGELRVLVYNIGSESIADGQHTLVSIPVTGSAELVSAEAADYNGSVMEVAVHNIPSEFVVNQNYPNPFNPTTTIAFSLPIESDYSVKVYNIAGQLVNDYSGHSAAGNVEVVWDGSDATGNSVASGIYFYKVTASNFSATKKMVLMK